MPLLSPLFAADVAWLPLALEASSNSISDMTKNGALLSSSSSLFVVLTLLRLLVLKLPLPLSLEDIASANIIVPHDK